MNRGQLLLLVLVLIGVVPWRSGAKKNMDMIDATSWATYAWAEPWKGALGTHTVQSRNDQVQAQDFEYAEASAQETPPKQPQKRHYLHYIPLSSIDGLERPRKLHFEYGQDEPIYEAWEQPPLLAKEGITSEEAAWVPQGQPLQAIKQSYSWGSKAFDQSFEKHPRLAVETHLGYEPYFPPPSYIPTTHFPRPKPLPPTTITSPPKPSVNPTYLPSTTPYSVITSKPVHKITKPHPTLSYHAHLPSHYHSVPHYSVQPRKYYLTDEHSLKYKHGYGLRKYSLNIEPTVIHSDPGDSASQEDSFLANEIETTADLADVTTSPASSASEEEIDSDLKQDEILKILPVQKPQLHTTYPPSYSYSYQPRPYSPVHPNYEPQPYGHFHYQRHHYPTNNLHHPTPANVRKYFLGTADSSSLEGHQPKSGDEQGKPDLSTIDIYEMLRMPRSAAATSWQSTRYGTTSAVNR